MLVKLRQIDFRIIYHSTRAAQPLWGVTSTIGTTSTLGTTAVVVDLDLSYSTPYQDFIIIMRVHAMLDLDLVPRHR